MDGIIEHVDDKGTLLSQEHELLGYADEEVFIVDNFKDIPNTRVQRIHQIVVIICKRGKLQVVIDGKEHRLSAKDAIVLLPNTVTDSLMASPDVSISAFGFTSAPLERSIHKGKDLVDCMLYLHSHPVTQLTDEDLELFEAYFTLLRLKLKQPKRVYHQESMRRFLGSCFFELFSIVNRNSRLQPTGGIATQSDLLFRRFLTLLQENGGHDRSVVFYAQKLCVTPKYLSSAVKMASGKTALVWIHDFAIENIKQSLRYSTRTIKEIAEDYNFPNASFFGKFVKSQIGLSPKEYRRKQTELTNV